MTSARMLIILLSLAGSPGSTTAGPPRVDVPSDEMTQVSVINALMLGQYDGVMSIPEILRLGDFGVGTLDHLDGELIILDGQAYQARGDGAVAKVGQERSSPFVTIKSFHPDGEVDCPPLGSLDELDAFLDRSLSQNNGFIAIRVDGVFASISLRSVPRQEPPYKPLAEVARAQKVWDHTSVRGTLVGIRCPDWVAGLNVPGYHWHFLSHDREVGGHVLDCHLTAATVRYDESREWILRLPDSRQFDEADLTSDLRDDLERVENARRP